MEVVSILEKFVNLYESNQIPNWITILSAVVPIIISIIVLCQNHITFKRNEQLQKDIAKNNEKLQEDLAVKNEKLQIDIQNNEIKIKRYDIILNAYVAFIDAYAKLPSIQEGLQAIVEDCVRNRDILIDLIKERDKLILECGKLKLLLKEDKILIEKVTELRKKYEYIVNKISNCAVINKKIEIDEILKNIKDYQNSLEYDNYDKYFEKYLALEEMK